jgi:CBS domain-containing protein
MARLTKTAGEILDQKKTGIVAVRPGDTVLEALRLMAGKNIGAVLVIEAGRLAGILSERDYARKVELAGKTAAATAVREIMTASVVTVTPDQPAQACVRLMSAKRIRHLPVVEGERVVGMLSNRDVLEEVIAEEEKLIRSLETERLIATTDPGTY